MRLSSFFRSYLLLRLSSFLRLSPFLRLSSILRLSSVFRWSSNLRTSLLFGTSLFLARAPKVPSSRAHSVRLCVCVRFYFSNSDWWKVGDVARRRQRWHGVARLLLMAPIVPWRNSTQIFGAVALCTTNIEDFRKTFDGRRPLTEDDL